MDESFSWRGWTWFLRQTDDLLFPRDAWRPKGLDQIELPRLFHIMKIEFRRNAREFGNAENPAVQIGLDVLMQFLL
jgi:hypothetical protein